MLRALMAVAFISGLMIVSPVVSAGAQGPENALAQVPQSRQMLQMSFAPLVKKTGPAVVNIYAKRIVKERAQIVSPFFNDPFFNQFFNAPGFAGPVRERVENALGSGVIVDAAGIIATNTHVIKGATAVIAVMSDGREFAAEMVLVDDKTDLAILRINPGAEKLPYLEMADSDGLEVGDIVLAIGNPFGVGQTVTSGIISALARTGVGTTDYGFFIQTDAAINPGNSGGALVDVEGRLVGVNSMIFSKDGGSLGIGFAIPSNMVKTVVLAAERGGKLVRPWTGFAGQPVMSDMVESLKLKRAQGVLVNKVYKNGPAEKAGMKVGDVILSVNGKEVQDPEALKFRMAMVPMGTQAQVTVWRNGITQDLAMLTEAPPETPARDTTQITGLSPLSGAVVVNISPAVSEEMRNLQLEDGVVIIKAEAGHAARLLTKGDIILSVNGQKVRSVQGLLKILKSAQTRRWQVEIMRGNQVLNLMITL